MSVLERPTKLYTAADLERLSAQGFHYELIEGELREMSPPGTDHGVTNQRLSRYLGNFIEENDLGTDLAAETGVFLRRHPDTVKAPDWAFIAKERMPTPRPKGYLPVVPDIILETRSPNDTTKEVAQKIQEWLDGGVKVVWAMNPQKKTLTIYRPGEAETILTENDTLTEEELLPGLAIALQRVFR